MKNGAHDSISDMQDDSRTMGKNMILDTFYHIAKRDPCIRTCTAVAMENVRLAVTEADIETHFQYLRDTVDNVSAHFVFNMDEMGHQPSADALAVTCFISATHIIICSLISYRDLRYMLYLIGAKNHSEY
jgi:hypothetical protein